MTESGLSREEVHRYARHLALPHVGREGQERLKEARVLCVGAGGLGSPAALYLAAAGVGTLGLVDADAVDLTNLQRQILHGTPDVGRAKVESAAERLAHVNPHVRVVGHDVRLTSANALDVLAGYDVVVDGTDNFPTRYLVNDACVLLGKPNVYGAVVRWEGQVSVFAAPGGPCYRCLFREPPPPGLVLDCAEGGVMGVLPGIVGSLQALEALKLVLGAGDPLVGRLLVFEALELTWREVALRRNPECPVCGDHPTQTSLIDYQAFCGLAGGGDPSRDAVPVPEGVEEMDPEDVLRALEGREPPLLVDVREPWEWEVGSLEGRGAVLVPLGRLGDAMERIPRDRTVVVYCRSGVRSAEAARLLGAAGHPRVFNLRGGVQAWARDVDPHIPVA